MNTAAARRLALVASAGVGVLLQASRHSDPTFFLLYFTVWCAILSALAAGASLAGRQRDAVGWVRDASCVGAVLSGVVYLLVLLPANGFNAQDATAWAGNALLHVAVPALAVGEFLRAPRRRGEPGRRVVASWALLPAAYLILALVLARVGVTASYQFLDAATVGGPGVVAVALAGIGGYLLLAGLLLRWRPTAAGRPQ